MKYVIEIIDDKIYINGNHHYCDKIDEFDSKDNLSKQILICLATEMNYEPEFLFEELVDDLRRLAEEE